MKVFTALLGTETNTFSPFLTGMRNFEETYLVRSGNHGRDAMDVRLATDSLARAGSRARLGGGRKPSCVCHACRHHPASGI